VSRPVLLDASFLIALEREPAVADTGPARHFLSSLRGRPLVVSIVTVEEILEGAADENAALAALQRFSIQGLHLAQARRCALNQRRASRRMGENDARLMATADSFNADIVGADMISDPDHSVYERRMLTTGYSNRQRLIIVAHTDRDGQIRIISARDATPSERRDYAEEPK